jgi:hypothetical protein
VKPLPVPLYPITGAARPKRPVFTCQAMIW